MSERTCGDCDHHRYDLDKGQLHHGECRRFPPSDSKVSYVGLIAVYKVTLNDTPACGEFRPHPPMGVLDCSKLETTKGDERQLRTIPPALPEEARRRKRS